MKSPFRKIAKRTICAALFTGLSLLSCRAEVSPADNKTASLEPPEHYAQITERVGWLLPQGHLMQYPLDDRVSARAWTNYLSMLDYERVYFLQSDIDEFEQSRDTLDDAVRAGDLTFAFEVFERFRQRLGERHAHVVTLLDEGFDFTVPETYMWKRKEAPWPATPAEQDELWRLRIKNEYLGFVIAREYGESNKTARAAAATNGAATVAISTNAAGHVVTNMAPAAMVAATNAPVVTVISTNAAGNVVTNMAPAAMVAATNGPVVTVISTNAAGNVVTNIVPSAGAAVPPVAPEEFVRKRYDQFRIVIDDSDAEWVLQRFLGAVAGAYDPHTAYMPPTAVDDFNIDMNLSLSGIGALLSPEDGAAKIQEIIPGGPAARDTRDIRLVPGDKIIGVGQDTEPIEDVLHLPLNKIVRKIRGKKGSRVVLRVISASDPSGSSTRAVDLIRDDVRLEEQAATGRVVRVAWSNGTTRAFGVVKLPTFYGSMTSNPQDPGFRSCTYDIARIITGMNDDIEGLILDLRGNGGGSLREAVDLAGRFIRLGPVVQQREERRIMVHTDRDPAVTFRKPMIVLVNRASASASEIVAAALQDYGRALIVGDSRTHGKGSVQTIVPLSRSDARLGSLKVTIASYYRISGGSTQLRGVESDIVLPSVLEHLDMGEDKLPNAMPWTRIPATDYSIVYDLRPLIPALATNMHARLAVDEDYQRHRRTVEHVRQVNERRELPLDAATRYRLYAAEREIQRAEGDEYDAAAPEDGAPGESPPEEKLDDVVLDASLHVLADLVDLQGGIAIDPVLDNNTLGAQDWLRRLFQP